jgi:hypothetical protein
MRLRVGRRPIRRRDHWDDWERFAEPVIPVVEFEDHSASASIPVIVQLYEIKSFVSRVLEMFMW